LTLGIALTSDNDQERETGLFRLWIKGLRLSHCLTLGIELTSDNGQE